MSLRSVTKVVGGWLSVCTIRDGKKIPSNKQIAQKLEQMGCIEKHGKTNAVYYILPRRYYELAGDLAAYSLATDWDINQVWAVIQPFLQKYGKAKRADLDKIIGNHLSEKQMRRHLELLKAIGFLETEGQTNQTVYILGKNFNPDNTALPMTIQRLDKSVGN